MPEEHIIKEVDLKSTKEIATKKRNIKKLFATIAVIIFAVYALMVLVDQQMQINQAKNTLESLSNDIQLIETNIEQLENMANADDSENQEYIEKIARNQYGYAKKGERIFINIAG